MRRCESRKFLKGSVPDSIFTVQDPCGTMGGAQYTTCKNRTEFITSDGEALCEDHADEYRRMYPGSRLRPLRSTEA